MDNIYEDNQLTIFKVLQYMLLGAFIPLVTGMLVIQLLVGLEFAMFIFPIGIPYMMFIGVLFLVIMILFLKYAVHEAFKYLNITGKGKMIADISYIAMCVAIIFIIDFPMPV